ncbi:MAG: DNA-directed RNA polymerase subunit D [Candidatus Methanogranum gryphiswaldense]|jgi:DNA-directed RNA polymerase subunit D|nr:MAG: DNA-directed RNA polymerase subunit D [Candidatus Methanogranum sp. U3.2.1]
MDIEILEMAERKGKFILKNSSPAMANALRRTMLSDIPKMAIDKVEFHLGPIMVDDKEYESVTPLFDEIIAHRLGMIPVPTDYELFTYQDKCVCGGDGCPSCTLMYSLNKIGPCTVLSGDMVPLGNPDLKVKDENIPIVELTDGQAVLIYATAVMGTCNKHVKWQAAFGVGYKYLPVISINSEKANDPDVLNVIKHCPRHVFGEKNKKLVVVNPHACSLCDTCKEITNGAVHVKGDDKNFLFTFETDGSLTAKQVLEKAVEILSEEAKELAMQADSL